MKLTPKNVPPRGRCVNFRTPPMTNKAVATRNKIEFFIKIRFKIKLLAQVLIFNIFRFKLFLRYIKIENGLNNIKFTR